MHILRHAIFDLAVTAAFGAVIYVMEIADWDHGVARNVALSCASAAVAALYARRSMPPAIPPRRYVHALCLVAGLLLGFRTVQSWDQLGTVPLDIAFSTLDSIKAVVREHKDPYANPIDSRKEAPKDARGFGYYHGYKYLPAMLAVYAPLAVKFEFPGMFFTNYLLFLLTGLFIYLLAAAHRVGGNPEDGLSVSGLRGLILYLSLGVVALELFVKGANDLAPTALLLCSIYALARGWMIAAGIMIGLSLGTKLLPGAALILLVIPLAFNRRFIVAAAITLAVLVLPFLLWHPREFIANVLLFNFDRPPDTTSIAYYLPRHWQPWWLWTGRVLTVALIAGWLLKKEKTWQGLVFMSMVVLTVFLVFGTMVHRNYLLWIIPLYCVTLPSVAFPREARKEGGAAPGGAPA